MQSDIVITHMAMATSVGLNAVQTCTSVRAGIVRFAELTWREKTFGPIVMAAIPDNCLPDLSDDYQDGPSLTFQEKRMLQLAGLVQDELAKGDIEPGIPLIIGLPEKTGLQPIDPGTVLKGIIRQTGLTIDTAKSRAIAKGRAAGLLAIHEACELLHTGKADKVLVGGCDSYKAIYVLEYLNALGRLNSEINLDGFIPGEGVCFLLLMTERAAKRSSLPILGRIRATAVGFEEGHLNTETPYKGEGLFKTLETLFHGDLPGMPIKTVYSSMNGESYWAKEWGVCSIRFKEQMAEDMAFEHPADCYGDPGAASGPVMTGLALTGMEAGYRKGPVLVYASSDRGDRGAVIVDKSEGEKETQV